VTLRSLARSLAREPLIQFLAMGAAVAALVAAFGAQAPDAPAGRIVITAERVAALEDGFRRTWGRTPDEDERDRLVRSLVREEMLYREALRRGLAGDDEVVRRRLAQKMAFLLEPAVAGEEPARQVLERFLADHMDDYLKPPLVAFRQVYLSRKERGERLDADAAALIEELEAGADPSSAGDEILLPAEVESTSILNVQRIFGPELVDALAELTVGEWSGPVESAYGAHLVHLSQRTAPREPSLEEVRSAVLRDYRAAERTRLMEARFDALAERYEVVVEEPRTPGASAPAAQGADG